MNKQGTRKPQNTHYDVRAASWVMPDYKARGLAFTLYFFLVILFWPKNTVRAGISRLALTRTSRNQKGCDLH
jgi:hypothetical protein